MEDLKVWIATQIKRGFIKIITIVLNQLVICLPLSHVYYTKWMENSPTNNMTSDIWGTIESEYKNEKNWKRSAGNKREI